MKRIHGLSIKERLSRICEITDEGCWEAQQGIHHSGYAELKVNGRKQRVHRLAYEAYVGPIGTAYVLHKCDNKRCFNPAHLFLGTQADNVADMMAKGRGIQLAGEDHGAAKVSNAQRKLIALDKRKQKEIANTYGLAQSTVSMIQHKAGVKRGRNFQETR